MELKAQAGKIVAAAKEEVWGQVFQSDRLFLVVGITVPEGYEAAPLGKEIISNLSSKFNELPDVNLKNLKDLVSLKDGFLLDLRIPEGTNLNLLVCALVDNIFYLLILGQGKVFLKRGERLATILEKEGAGSGRLEENDLLILTSPKFTQVISLQTLKATLDHFSPQEIAENLAPLVHASEDSFGAAALILSFEKRKEFFQEEKGAVSQGGRFCLFSSRRKSLVASLKSLLKSKPSFFLLKRKLSQENRTKKTVLTVALILTALLLVSIIFGFGKREKNLSEKKFQEVFEKATHQFEKGRALLDLNTQKSREILRETQALLMEAKDEFKRGSKERRKIEEFLPKVEDVLKEAEKVYKLADAPLFFDPVFLKDKAFGEDLALYKDSLVILDKKQSTLYYLTLKDKSGKILAGGEKLKGSKVVGIHGDKVYALVDEGIMETDVKAKTSDLKIKKEDQWEIQDLVAYRGNIYLLVRMGVIKYLRTDEGFVKRNYLSEDIEHDFSSARSMAIDGDVWIAKPGEVLRFSLGQKQEFSTQGPREKLGFNLIIYTDEECENIYVLDKGQKRIVALNKNGEYQAQYEWDKIAEVDDIVVSEKAGMILVLVEGKIYGIEIK